MSSDKPTKSDILEELESIRGFLNEDDDLIDDIPTLTVVAAEDAPTAPSIDYEDIPSLTERAESPEPAEELELDLDLDELIIEEDEDEDVVGENTPPKPAPSERDKAPRQEIQDELPFPKMSEPEEPEAVEDAPMPKGAGENPFLPPHIRERLGRHKEVFTQFQEYEAQQKLNNKSTGQSNLLAESEEEVAKGQMAQDPLESTKDALIDDIIGEFLPKIEARLREKLKSHLNAWKDD